MGTILQRENGMYLITRMTNSFLWRILNTFDDKKSRTVKNFSFSTVQIYMYIKLNINRKNILAIDVGKILVIALLGKILNAVPFALINDS